MTLTERATGVDLDVVPLSGSIGAVIRGLDLRTLDDDTVAAVRRVWLERKVVFFTGQDLSPEEHLAFATRFGEPTEGHPVVPGLPDRPEVFEIDYTAARRLYSAYGDVSTRARGISWHTDVTFVKRPPLGPTRRPAPRCCSSIPGSRPTSRSWNARRATPCSPFLHEHSVKAEYTVRYHWNQGDIAFWDNRATQHSVVGDFGDQHRVIQRVTLRGDEPA